MTEWSNIIGNFKNLQSSGTRNVLAKFVYLTVLKVKDDIVDNANLDDNPFYMYETLAQALAGKGTKENPIKNTYKGDKKTTDKKTKKTTVQKNVDIPVKKFVTVTGEASRGLTFLLNMYIKECKDYYDSNKHSFGPDDKLLTKIVEYAESQTGTIAGAIIRASDAMDANNIVESNFADIKSYLTSKTNAYFKTSENATQDTKIEIVVSAFIRFLKILSIMMGGILYDKRVAVNKPFLNGMIRQLNSFLHMHGTCIEPEVLANMSEYIEATKPAKSEKKEKKEKSDEDGDEEEEEEEESEAEGEDDEEDAPKTAPKKPTPVKKPAAKPVAETKSVTKPAAPKADSKPAAAAPKADSKSAAKPSGKKPSAKSKAAAAVDAEDNGFAESAVSDE
jgi:hypothetical protein